VAELPQRDALLWRRCAASLPIASDRLLPSTRSSALSGGLAPRSRLIDRAPRIVDDDVGARGHHSVAGMTPEAPGGRARTDGGSLLAAAMRCATRRARTVCSAHHAFESGGIYMRHHASMSAVENEWAFASVARPCTICAGHDRCRRGSDGEFACCTRVPSEWPLSAGGWVHRVSRFSLSPPRGIGDPSDGAREHAALAMSPAQ
jgi:hypothetical protein